MRSLFLSAVFVGVVLCQHDYLEKLRPPTPADGFEGRDFWNEYAMKDLERRMFIEPNFGVAKNVIIFLGDGMGVSTVALSRIYKGQESWNSQRARYPGADPNGEGEELLWERFPYTGLSKTYNVNYQVSDSSGAASALLTGVKANFGMAGLDGSLERQTCDPVAFEKAKLAGMVHWAQAAGKGTGLVTTTRVNHASPANLYAHTADRNWEYDTKIPDPVMCNEDTAKQLIYSEAGRNMKVVFGGGRRNFKLKEGSTDDDPGKRSDEDLLQAYYDIHGESGWILENSHDLDSYKEFPTDKVLGLFAPSHLPYEVERPEDVPSLSRMTEVAISRLSLEPNGYFLFVEGGRIDHGHHANNAKMALEEAWEMERALERVLESVNLDETLIIVTADHSHSVTFNGYPKRGNPILGHTEEYPLSISEYSDGTKLPYSTISYANGPGFNNHFIPGSTIPWRDVSMMEWWSNDYLQPAMMPGPEKEETHGGEDVPIYAIGPMSHLLTGVHEQNYIAHVMALASCIGPYENCPR